MCREFVKERLAICVRGRVLSRLLDSRCATCEGGAHTRRTGALMHPPGALGHPLPCRLHSVVSYSKHLFRIRKHLCHIRSTLVHIRTTWFIYEPLIRIRTTHFTEPPLALHMNTRRDLTMVSNIAMGSNTVLSGLKYGPQAQIRSHPKCHI